MKPDFKICQTSKLSQSEASFTYAVAEDDGQHHSYAHSD